MITTSRKQTATTTSTAVAERRQQRFRNNKQFWILVLGLLCIIPYWFALLSSLCSSNQQYHQEHGQEQEQLLAYVQSFGFFDDIPNEMWLRAQEIHTKVFPNYFIDQDKDDDEYHKKQNNANKENNKKNINKSSDYHDADTIQSLKEYSNLNTHKGNYGKLKNSHKWNGQNFQIKFHCPLAQRVPPTSQGDGPKWVCDPHRLQKRQEQHEEQHEDKRPNNDQDCLIYSFGSNGKPEFEQGIHDIAPNCEIHTFDMVTSNRRNGDFAQALNGTISVFHAWGLGTEQEARQSPKRFKTLSQTMQVLGHVGRRIDIFKIDCEWCEWFTYDQWLEQDIRQILVETHNAPLPAAQDFFFELHNAGYVIFSKEANYFNQGGGVEFGFVKLHSDFFQGRFYYNNSRNNMPTSVATHTN